VVLCVIKEVTQRDTEKAQRNTEEKFVKICANSWTIFCCLKGVREIKVQKNVDNEHIPGLPYTYEERIADINIAEENYATGRTISSEEINKTGIKIL